MSDEYLRLDQIDKRDIRKTSENEIKFLQTQYKNQRKIPRLIYYGLLTAFVLQLTYIAVTFSHAVAFIERKPGLPAYVLLGIIGTVIFLFRKTLNNNGTYPVKFKLKGTYRRVKEDGYADPKKVSLKHFFHPYQVDIPDHWLKLGFLKSGKEYTFEGCPTDLSFIRDVEDENYDFGSINIYEDTQSQESEKEDPDDEEEFDICAVDFVYSIVSIDNKLSIDQEMEKGLNGFQWEQKYTVLKNIFLASLLIIYLFGIVDTNSLFIWGKQRLSGARGKQHYNSTEAFIKTPAVLYQNFTIENAALVTENYYREHLIDDIKRFEKDFTSLQSVIDSRIAEIRRLKSSSNYKLKSEESWRGYSKIINHPEFAEMKKAMVNQDKKLVSLRDLPDKNRAREVLKRVFSGIANKNKYMDKLYEAEVSFLNKTMSEFFTNHSSLDISVKMWDINNISKFTTTDLRFNRADRLYSKIRKIIYKCRREGAVSGILTDFRYHKNKLSRIYFQHISPKRPYLARYYQLRPFAELAIITILISGYLFFFLKDRKTKQYNRKLRDEMKRIHPD